MFENGAIGIVFSLLTLWRTDWADPLAPGVAQSGLAYSIGQTYEDREEVSQEFRLSYIWVAVGIWNMRSRSVRFQLMWAFPRWSGFGIRQTTLI